MNDKKNPKSTTIKPSPIYERRSVGFKDNSNLIKLQQSNSSNNSNSNDNSNNSNNNGN